MGVSDFRKYEELGPYHWTGTFGPWPRASPRLQSLYALALRAIGAQVRIRGGKGLDVGCGEGTMLRMAAERGARMVGLDSTLAALRLARRLLAAYSDAVLPAVRGDAQVLPFRAGTFDFVTCLEVIEHLERPEVLIEELYRVLRPGGVAAVSTPRAREDGVLHDPYHIREFRPEEFRSLARTLFERVAVWGVYPRFLDRLYVRGTGCRGWDRAVRAGFKLAARLGLNPYRIAGLRPVEGCAAMLAVCSKL